MNRWARILKNHAGPEDVRNLIAFPDLTNYK